MPQRGSDPGAAGCFHHLLHRQPLYVYKSRATILYLPEGTASTLTDGTDYTFSDSYSSAEEEEPNACLYSRSDLIIAGSGSLTVNANYNNGITGKDTLFIKGLRHRHRRQSRHQRQG